MDNIFENEDLSLSILTSDGHFIWTYFWWIAIFELLDYGKLD